MEVKHIGIFGRRNVGKSSLINTITGQDLAIVSSQAGTTTDPVKKRMEIIDFGPVQFIDTAGIDDNGAVGNKRVEKSMKVISEIDLGIIVFTNNFFGKEEKDVLKRLKDNDVPVILVHNQSDIIQLDADLASDLNHIYGCDVLEFSCCLLDEQLQKESVDLLISFIIKCLSEPSAKRTILQGLVNENDNIVLVCPIDSEAPSGRLILPQVLAIRDILDKGGRATVLQPEQLKSYLDEVFLVQRNPDKFPKLVVTDSQVFKKVSEIVPENIRLTSFSVLMARAKGPFDYYKNSSKTILGLKDGDNVLIMESCTHHSTCEDIGRVKLPAMLNKFLNRDCGSNPAKKLNFTYVAGLSDLPKDLSKYALAIQCGGCMVTRKQLNNRVEAVKKAGVPVTNYGMAIAFMSGIFNRAVDCLDY